MKIITMTDFIHSATEFSRDFELCLNLDDKKLQLKTVEFLEEEVKETYDSITSYDTLGVIDGYGDVAFVALNGIYKTFRQLGHPHDMATQFVIEVMQRICKANNAKRQSDGTVKYVNNKVVKPEGWTPPQYSDLL